MSVLLVTKKEVQFVLNETFQISHLAPIGEFVQWKLIHDWDDYNELFHAAKLVQQIAKIENVWLHTHTLTKRNKNIGVLLIVGGDIHKIENKYPIAEKSLLLKYFHIAEKGQGHGSFWLKKVILPHYKKDGYQQIYINSSHPKSFPFYEKTGDLITTYQQWSDNHLYQRIGNCYKVVL